MCAKWIVRVAKLNRSEGVPLALSVIWQELFAEAINWKARLVSCSNIYFAGSYKRIGRRRSNALRNIVWEFRHQDVKMNAYLNHTFHWMFLQLLFHIYKFLYRLNYLYFQLHVVVRAFILKRKVFFKRTFYHIDQYLMKVNKISFTRILSKPRLSVRLESLRIHVYNKKNRETFSV